MNKIIIEPIHVFWNVYGTICIANYLNFFHIYHLTCENQLKFHKQMRESIISGYFWENLFFFSTENEVFLLVCDMKNDAILIKLATVEIDSDLTMNLYEDNENIDFYDCIYPKLQKRSPGHIKFLMIFDCKLITINQFQEMSAICLDHEFIRFCMYLQFGELEKCFEIVSKFDDKLSYIFADIFNVLFIISLYIKCYFLQVSWID